MEQVGLGYRSRGIVTALASLNTANRSFHCLRRSPVNGSSQSTLASELLSKHLEKDSDGGNNPKWVKEFCRSSDDTPLGWVRSLHGHSDLSNVKLELIIDEISTGCREFCVLLAAGHPQLQVYSWHMIGLPPRATSFAPPPSDWDSFR